MNLHSMNEAFKRKYSDVLNESIDESYKAQLKKALVMRSMNVVANGGNIKDLEIALQSVIEEFFPDKCWWEVTDCNIFMELLGGVNPREVCDMIVDQLKSDCCDGDDCPQFVDTRKQSIISGDPSMDNGVDLYEGSIEETVSNTEKTISKIDKNLAKVVDTDMVRDLTLIIENDGDVYRRFTTPVIANLKRKRAKGNFDDKLAIQAFVHVVENALRQPYFYRYYSYDIKSVPVSVRYAVAKELLDGAMEEIEFEDTNESVSKSRLVEKPIYDLDTQYDSRKSFYSKAKVDTGYKGDKNKLYSYNTLVAEIVDGKPVVHGTYSSTTLRHIKEWLKQLGYRADSAKQIMQDYGAMTESFEDRLKDPEVQRRNAEYAARMKAKYDKENKLAKEAKTWPDDKELTYEEAVALAKAYYNQGGDMFYETTDERQFDEEVSESGPMTVGKMKSGFDLYDSVRRDRMAEGFVDTNEGLRESKSQVLPKYVVDYSPVTNNEVNSDYYTTDMDKAIRDAKRNGADRVIKQTWRERKNGDTSRVGEETVWERPTKKNESMFDDMEPEVWDYQDTDSRYRDTYSYSPYDNAHNEIADRIRRKGYIGSYSHSDGMTPINLNDKSAPKFNKNYLRSEKKKKELLGV